MLAPTGDAMTLCLTCRVFLSADEARCPTCGDAASPDDESTRGELLDRLLRDRIDARVKQWVSDGMLSAAMARQLASSLYVPLPSKKPVEATAAKPVEATVAKPVEATVAKPEDALLAEHTDAPREAHREHAREAPQSLFANSDAVHGAVDALVALDATEPSRWETELRPLLYENIGWFIGTLFILAGSVYGVREAWRTLGGVPRHLLVAGALMAYHAAFVGVAKLLSTRSATTGRVLGGIAAALLPVVFVALSSLTALDRAAGVGASLVCAAIAAVTLRSVGSRFAPSASLAAVMVPLLVAEVPMSSLAVDAWPRVALCFVGTAVTWWAASRALPDAPPAEEPGLHPLVAALYGTITVAVFAVSGASDGGSDLGALAPAFALWVSLHASALVASAGRLGATRRSPQAASVVEVLSLAAVAIATIWGAGLALNLLASRAVPGMLSAATAAVATVTFALSARRRGGALHFVTLAATLSTTMCARALAPLVPAWWLFGAMVAPSAALLVASRLEGDARARDRAVLSRWATLIATAVGLVALAVAPSRGSGALWTPFVATFAALALSAHASASPSRRSPHALGALASLVTLFGAVAASREGFSFPPDAARLSGVAALALAVTASLVGALRGRSPDDVPWRAALSTLRDALASTAYVTFVAGVASVGAWISAWNGDTRAPVVEGALLLGLSSLAAFVGHGFALGDLRARPAPLWAAGLTVALAAVSNRIGRPLPPEVVGQRLSLIAVALWLFARALVAAGPRIATWLGREGGGRGYHAVPHAGVFALGALLVVDAALVGSPSIERTLLVAPPTMLLGAALAAMLLGRSARHAAGAFVAGGLALGGAALVAVQHAALGRPSVNVTVDAALRRVPADSIATADPIRWSDPNALLLAGQTLDGVYASALLGVALSAALFALSAAVFERFEGARRVGSKLAFDGAVNLSEGLIVSASLWAGAGATCCVLSMAWRPDLALASIVTATGAALLAARARRTGAALTVAGLASLILAAGARSSQIPWWMGPATMALAAVPVHLGPLLIARYELVAARAYGRLHSLAFVTGLVALVEAFAANQSLSSQWVVADVAWGALFGLIGRWMLSPSAPVTLALAAWVMAVCALQWRRVEGRGSRVFVSTAASSLLAGLAAGMGVLSAWVIGRAAPSPDGLTLPFARGIVAFRLLGTPLALTATVVALASHVVGRRAVDHPSMARGARFGRDVWLASSVVLLALFSSLASTASEAPPSSAVPIAVLAMAVGVITAGHAAWREATGRHVYFVQTAIVAVYGVVRSEIVRGLAPEVDAIFALVMGFLLVGVTVQARRAGIPPVAVATRRFAALLPFAIALVLPQEASVSSALAAAGSAVLYATLGWVERSRLLGSLGAAAGNLALLLFALSSGVTGVEVWLAPMGLFVLALAQIFGPTLGHGARVALRVVGALLLYLPAAAQIALQVGNARDGMYPLIFGLACLVGVAAGMLMHIRAYLALGVGFLVLDVGANLTHASLRDHRVGFVVLSLSGMAILGAMVLTTLRREAFRAWLDRWRTRLRAWD